MALVDRLATSGADHIAIHRFSAATFLWAQGVLTRAQVVTGLSLTAADEPQLDQLATYYDTLTANGKSAFHGRVESLGVLLEHGDITTAFFKNNLGMT